MISVIATKQAQNWLETNLAQYKYYPTLSYATCGYKGRYPDGDFDIIVYNTNLCTIKGSFANRIYRQLILNSGEYDYTGCDEVGVGDFFGPVVFASIKLNRESLIYLSETPVNIKDSKKLSDDEILEIYSKLKDNISHNFQVVYDQYVDDNLNSISMKSYYHNQNLITTKTNAIIDLYTTENSFNKYTKQLNLTWPTPLILETKADSKFVSVALASIFARAKFIQEMDNLESKYDYNFPYGANNVLPTAREFVKDYSKEELATFCKTSFKTFDEI